MNERLHRSSSRASSAERRGRDIPSTTSSFPRADAPGPRDGAVDPAARPAAGRSRVRLASARSPRDQRQPQQQQPQQQSQRPAAPRDRRSDATPAKPRRSRYIPALDGLRTLAVIAVVLYHLNLGWAQGGLLGVTMFFVLSGYLITRLLLAEFDQSGTIDLKDFWLRRVRRLVPAIVTVVVVTIVLCTIFNHVMLTKMRPDILPSLLFFNNWWQIFNNVSYFNALGDPSPLTHFWSLAIEEQFYLMWPPVLFVLLRLGGRHRVARRVALVLAIISAGAMMILYNPAQDPSRLYYGTDTRAFSLLLGAWLAFIPEGAMRPTNLLRAVHLDRVVPALAGDSSRIVRAGLTTGSVDLMGAIGLVGLVLMTVFTNGYTAFQYQGGTLLATVLTMMVIAACVQPEGIIARALALRPLVWLGKRSYSIYLWHYPLLLLMNPVADVTEKPWWALVIQALIVVGAAELSYRFIEAPFRNGALGRFIARVREQGLNPAAIVRAHPVRLGATAVVLLVALGGLVLVPNTSALSDEGAAILNQDDGAVSADGSDAAANTGTTGDAATTTSGDTEPVIAGEDGFPAGSYDILMVGDSVSLRAVPDFQSTFLHGHIDAAKNRQFTAGEETYRSYVQQNLAGRIAVFALGTNGLVTDEAVDTLMADVGEDRIAVFVNTRSPQPWVQDTNAAIARAAERYSNVRVIDWYSYSSGRNDLFDGDGTHLSSTGAREYISLIYNAVKDDLPVHPEDHAQDPQVTTARGAATAVATAIAQHVATELGAENAAGSGA